MLDTIPGVDKRAAEMLLAEIGPDMSRFPTDAHLASWGGVCPGQRAPSSSPQARIGCLLASCKRYVERSTAAHSS